MEKQTKILLGVGAVIAAYLILKPKKAKASDDKPMPTKVDMPSSGICPNGYVEDVIYCITTPCPQGGCRLATTKEQEEYKLQIQMRDLQSKVIPTPPIVPYIDTAKLIEKWLKNQNCVCDQSPCNCRGSEPKVQTDYAPRSNNVDYLTPWS